MKGSWKLFKVGDIFKISSGGTPSRNKPEYFENGNIPWVKTGDLKGVFVKFPEEKITDLALANSSAKIFPKNTVLLAMYGATIGACSILPFEASTNQACAAFLPNEKCNVYFLYYFLSSIKQDLIDLGVGGGQPNISAGIIKDLQIPLPPLETQQKIAAILDAADTLRQKDKALVAKYDELTQALFLDMFGDPVSNPKGWEKLKLGLVTNMKAGKFISASEIRSETGKDLFACYGGNGIRGYVKSYTHDGCFVLIGRQGALCGNVKTVNGKFHATEHAIVCSPKMEYETLWFYYLLEILNLNRFATGAAQPGLNVGTLVDLDIIFAPYQLQNQFAERVAIIEKQKAIAQTSLEKSEELFNSLLQKAFKGELV